MVKQFMKEFGMNYPVVMGNIKIMKDFGGTGIPTTFVIDRRGKIVARHSGFAPKESKKKSRPCFEPG